MNNGHFKWEMLRLVWDEWSRKLVTDRFLTDYSAIWRHLPHDQNGVSGSEPPKWWTDQYMQLERKQAKDVGIATIEGYTCQIDSDTGNLTIISPMPNVQLSKQGQRDLVALIMRGAPPEMPVQGTVVPTSPQASWEFNPVLKQRHEQNMETFEKWAKASSESYPKSK